ncbi:MAG: SpoIIE family protein phosphatase [Mycobacteriales bacterium]
MAPGGGTAWRRRHLRGVTERSRAEDGYDGMSPAGGPRPSYQPGPHDQLRQQIRNRALIERAEHVLSAQLGCTRPEAFEQLVSIARRMGIRPVDVAAELVGYGVGHAAAGQPVAYAAYPPEGHASPPTTREPAATEPGAVVSADTLFRLVAQAAWEPLVVLTPVRDGSGALTDFRVAAASQAATGVTTGRTLREQGPRSPLPVGVDVLAAVLATGRPYRDGDDRVSVSAGDGAVLVCWRPAESSGTRQSLLEQSSRLARLGAWEWDLVRGEAWWSEEACAIVGRAAPTGRVGIDSPDDLPFTVHPEDAPIVEYVTTTLRRDGLPADVEFRVIDADGAIRHVRLTGEPVTGPASGEGDGDGEPVAVRGIVQDVTSRRRAEIALEITRVQLAAQRARADTEHSLAAELQQALLPTEPARLAETAGLDVATRYRPAAAAARVGGDWYEVCLLPDKNVLLSVGDVAGHGVPAAAAMARLHHALQGLAVTGAGPAQLLAWLNAITCLQPGYVMASACCAIYHPPTRTLRWANAGHPPPVLVRAEEPRPLAGGVGPMLGVDPDATYTETAERLLLDDMLLLFTDGLIERRRSTPQDNLADLLEAARYPAIDPEEYVEHLLATTHPDTDDDTCLVAVRAR